MSSSTVAYLVQNPAKPPFAGAQILYTIYSSVLSIGVISGCAGPAAAWQVNPNKRTPAHETERTYLAIRHPRADDNVLDGASVFANTQGTDLDG
jgi:hypothetical protein